MKTTQETNVKKLLSPKAGARKREKRHETATVKV